MDGRALVDTDGTELADMAAVRAEAVRTAGEILADEDPSRFSEHDWQMTVADDKGKTVFLLYFKATDLTEPRLGSG
jgi:hypothetical protein